MNEPKTTTVEERKNATVVIPNKSPGDKREYRIITLDNGLQAVLVSDPTAEVAAAALDVHVGSWCDPDDIPGLAHFLEHMLFLGTEKYPEENAFHVFLTSNRGATNAFTDLEHTEYFFQLQAGALQEGLDRFAQFFIAPLYGKDVAERERKAVHNEHAKNRQFDDWRVEQMLRTTSNPKHPFSRFATGCLETLDRPGLDIRARLIQFHTAHYSANNMKLAVLGRESMDDLDKCVRERFSAIVNRKLPVPSPAAEAFPVRTTLGRQFWVESVKDVQLLCIVWPVVSVIHLYRDKPLSLIGHLLGHEGAGSMLSALKRKQWATALMSTSSDPTTQFTLFQLEITLTDQGTNHVNDILDLVFAYLAMLQQRDKSDEAWRRVHAEMGAVSKMNFDFKPAEPAGDYTVALAAALHLYDAADILTGPHLFLRSQLDLGPVYGVLQSMTRERMRVHRIQHQVPVQQLEQRGVPRQTDKWYGTNYWVEPLLAGGRVPDHPQQQQQQHKWPEMVRWPTPNSFVAQDFRIKHEQTKTSAGDPVKVEFDALDLWFQPDTVYGKPHAHLMLQLTTPAASATPESTVLSMLYTSLVEEDLNEFSYMARMAQFSFSLMHTPSGLLLVFSGFNDKLHTVVMAVLERMRNLRVDPVRFEIFRLALAKALANTRLNQPVDVALYKASLALSHRAWSTEDQMEALASVTPEQLQTKHVPRLFELLQCQMLVTGNVRIDEAKELAGQVCSLLLLPPTAHKLPSGQMPEQRAVALTPSPRRYVWQARHTNPNEQNSAAVVMLQLGTNTPETSAYAKVVHGFVQEPFFDTLRTKRQLGYVAKSQTLVVRRCIHWIGMIQSSDKTAPFLDEQVQRFLASIREQLGLLDEPGFHERLQGLIRSLLQPDRTLVDKTMRFWEEISHRTFVFDRAEREAHMLESMTLAKFLEFWDTHVAPSSLRRRALSVHVFGNQTPMPAERRQETATGGDGPIYLSDQQLTKWQQSMMLFPACDCATE